MARGAVPVHRDYQSSSTIVMSPRLILDSNCRGSTRNSVRWCGYFAVSVPGRWQYATTSRRYATVSRRYATVSRRELFARCSNDGIRQCIHTAPKFSRGDQQCYPQFVHRFDSTGPSDRRRRLAGRETIPICFWSNRREGGVSSISTRNEGVGGLESGDGNAPMLGSSTYPSTTFGRALPHWRAHRDRFLVPLFIWFDCINWTAMWDVSPRIGPCSAFPAGFAGPARRLPPET